MNLTQIKDYEIQCMLGQGAFGIVQRAVKKDNNVSVAIKQYDRAKLCQDVMRIDSLRKEISILSKLDHHGVMRFYDSIDSGNKINIVVEYINGNNIFQYIRKLPQSRL